MGFCDYCGESACVIRFPEQVYSFGLDIWFLGHTYLCGECGASQWFYTSCDFPKIEPPRSYLEGPLALPWNSPYRLTWWRRLLLLVRDIVG